MLDTEYRKDIHVMSHHHLTILIKITIHNSFRGQRVLVKQFWQLVYCLICENMLLQPERWNILSE